MTVDLLIEESRWNDLSLDQLADRAASAALAATGLDPDAFDISLLACDDARIASLNADFRGKPTPTNVLSWPDTDLAAKVDGARPSLPETAPQGPDEGFLGDIAIAYDTCAREAAELGITLADHATHLIVHGTLHLLGYDHERDLDATLMEGLETTTLGKLGIADPYRNN